MAARLARPPAYRLAVPAPTQALLTENDAENYAKSLADALVAQEVPAVSGERFPLDWTVEVVAQREGRNVTPRYVVRDADGTALGDYTGRPVPARDWVDGGAEIHRTAATLAAPAIAGLVARADARRRTGDENAVGANPPAVRLTAVRGAPGDGNQSLTARMAEQLARIGFRVQETAESSQFAVQGNVAVVDIGGGQQRVEIIWTVSRRDGYDLGRVLQLNVVPVGTLSGLWGDIALVVAQEASGGVRDVIANAGGFGEQQARPAQPPAAAEAAPESPPAAQPASAPASGRARQPLRPPA
ncbi:hypothetical protein [Falsiroseomonas sp. HW251]|uniref:hypothetical protein n=1 Tax=Falsiroseomonas sp. HW251 TaxID=3390998 RepID=UPI003D322D04